MKIVHTLKRSFLSLLPVVITCGVPLAAQIDEQEKSTMTTVLYEGPLTHDQNWVIKSGPVGPDNQKFRAFGGTCSMISGDIHNKSRSGTEKVVFTARFYKPGVWKMSWIDTITGEADDGNRYAYQQRFDYTGLTADGKAPRPNREMPNGELTGFLQYVPSNVVANALDLRDFFILAAPDGSVAASSEIHWTLRLQIPPASADPPPAFLPVVFFGKYIVDSHTQLGGQLGCDPL